jgi:hypothetical protein
VTAMPNTYSNVVDENQADISRDTDAAPALRFPSLESESDLALLARVQKQDRGWKRKAGVLLSTDKRLSRRGAAMLNYMLGLSRVNGLNANKSAGRR